MKYHEAICAGSGGGWDECPWTATDECESYDLGSYAAFETAIEAHIAPTRVPLPDGRAWPHKVYVVQVYR